MENAVATTWLVSFQQIQRQDELAADYLKFIACIQEKDIPEDLLPDAPLLEQTNALGTLKAFGFLKEHINGRFYDIHRLVHLATRNWLEIENTVSEWTWKALERLRTVIPYGGHENWNIWIAYLAHGVCLTKSSRSFESMEKSHIDLLWRIGLCQESIGQYKSAQLIYQERLELTQMILGQEDLETLASMGNLGNSLRKQGKYVESESLYRQTLGLQERILGKEHLDTLTTMSSLGNSLRQQGKSIEAEGLYRQTLELQERLFGKEHPDTLKGMNNLGNSLYQQGKYTEAKGLYQQTLELQKRVLGNEHPDTLVSIRSFASSLNQQGLYTEAERIFRQTLEIRERVLGKEHPDTLGSMNDLAISLGQQGLYTEVERIFRQTLEIQERVLGKEHPDTLWSMGSLASSLNQQGLYTEAERIFRQILELQERLLGKEHPDTLWSMGSLASSLGQQGFHIEAERIFRQTLEIRERVLGKEHPDTLRSMNNLAIPLGQQGFHAEAEGIFRQTLELRERVLGKEHPDTLRSMNNLAIPLGQQGFHAEAEGIFRQTLELQERVLGKEHPDTLRSMNNLATSLNQQGLHIKTDHIAGWQATVLPGIDSVRRTADCHLTPHDSYWYTQESEEFSARVGFGRGCADNLGLEMYQSSWLRRHSGTSGTSASSSDFMVESPTSSESPSERIRRRRDDPLGLTVLHIPPSEPTVDIIFVHGLGGSSRATWTFDNELSNFWPKEWLPKEPGLSGARISSFGYNGFPTDRNSSSTLNIADFARDLLLRLKIHDQANESNLGKIPIIFVVHSMGGLVTKQAYILGLNDPQFKDIVQNWYSIVFLATPHRGNDFSNMLNRILSVSPFGQGSKQFIAELQRNSMSLQAINDQFRNHFTKLQLVSFFETLETSVGPTKVLIVGKDSAVLGYRDEISAPLHANHHSIAKFKSPSDGSYVTIKDMLRSLACSFQRKRIVSESSTDGEVADELQEALEVGEEQINEDLDIFSDLQMQGTCSWLTSTPEFKNWMFGTSPTPTVLWIHGPPGVGKSVLSSFIVRHLKEHDMPCQFYFFRHSDLNKRRFNNLLRSLAYQLSAYSQEYQRRVIKLVKKRVITPKSDARVLWQRLFLGILSKIHFSSPIYWVIDSLDASNSPQHVLNTLESLAQLNLQLRILITGRHQELAPHFHRLNPALLCNTLALQEAQVKYCGQAQTDLARYVIHTLRTTEDRWGQALKDHVIATIIERAGGNFLWATVIVRKALQCNTREEIEETIDGLPQELRSLFEFIQDDLDHKITRPEELVLANKILTWVACSWRIMKLPMLQEAIDPARKILNLSWTISNSCGELIAVDQNTTSVELIHSSALEFLLSSPHPWLAVEPRRGNHMLFSRCLEILMDPSARLRLNRRDNNEMLEYSARNWAYHLWKSRAYESLSSTKLLLKFFQGPALLVWINALAVVDQLKCITYTSKMISGFLVDKLEGDRAENPLYSALMEEDILRKWTVDLVKIVGKFGRDISQYPELIYRLAEFCPKNSIFRQTFGCDSPLTITGNKDYWDDYLAKFVLEDAPEIRTVICSEEYFVVTDSANLLTAFHASTCETFKSLKDEGEIICARMSTVGSTLIACGVKHTTIWNLFNHEKLYSFENMDGARVLDACFTEGDLRVLTYSDNNIIRNVAVTNAAQYDPVVPDVCFPGNTSTPTIVRFKPDGSQIAFAYKDSPVSVWTTDSFQLVARCYRGGNKSALQSGSSEAVRMQWNAASGHLIGIFNGGCVFIWHPQNNKHESLNICASEIACSPSGGLFATAQSDGTLQVWNFYTRALVYQVQAASQSSALAISPDGRCVYDMRLSMMNIWQPNALVRLAEEEERDSDVSSSNPATIQESSAGPVSGMKMEEPISALAVYSHDRSFYSADDAGTLSQVFQDGTVSESIQQETVSHCLTVSSDGNRVASADSNGRVMVRDAKLSTQLLDEMLSFPATQLLFSPDGKGLLIRTTNDLQLHHFDSKTTLAYPGLHKQQYFNDPLNEELILGLTFNSLQVLKWSDLSQLETLRFGDNASLSTALESIHINEIKEPVDRVVATADGKLLVLSARCPWGFRQTSKVIIIPHPSSCSTATQLLQSVPHFVLNRLRLSIGLIDSSALRREIKCQDTLVFVDTQFWVCTWALDDVEGSEIRRHFLLPFDSREMAQLNLATVLRDGTFYCPRNGEVVVIQGGFDEEWD
ncbi:hypothetical protein BP6252_08240 [Coleophoma cylindrospora]|uniref:Uncharacterized protein n=1 Tax=Coleophoma cylindrospora TaxID=1849047 RepID=A0A3D8R5I9_9HELO|nr:hypothetical protein BP6252_08240 [Coleophoma cylindrospora]